MSSATAPVAIRPSSKLAFISFTTALSSSSRRLPHPFVQSTRHLAHRAHRNTLAPKHDAPAAYPSAPSPILRRLVTASSSLSLPDVQTPDAIPPLRAQFEAIDPFEEAPASQLIAAQFPFALDKFQRESLAALVGGSNVVLSAPTGAGKTVIGEMAIYLALCRGLRLFYTTPLKALSNQKFYDFKRQFGASRVGLLTGDLSVNRDAPIIVMTTEIYRNMLYAEASEQQQRDGPPPTDGLYAAVFDEFHYLNDRDRGTVWEEAVINSPPHVLLVALSATMSNAQQVADWFSNVQGKTQLVTTTTRPVPLKFGFCDFEGLTPLFADDVRPEARSKQRRVKASGFAKRTQPEASDKKAEPKMHPKLLRKLKGSTEAEKRSRVPTNRLDDDDADTVGKFQKVISRSAGRRDRSPGIPSFPFVVRTLYRRDMLPAIVFIFSRAGCDRAARFVASEDTDLVTPKERAEIKARLDAFVGANPDMIQPERLQQILGGVASHHAGLLPILKIFVEELFQDNLIKVIFATETLAAGINMPARTTVVATLSKRAGEEGIRLLTTSEVLQMAGRAGRRGKDIIGHSLILRSRREGALDAFRVLTQDVDKLESKFTPTYGMVLNLLLSRPLEEAKRLVSRSFGNFLRLQEQRMEKENRKKDGNNKKLSAYDIEQLSRERDGFQSVIEGAHEILSRVEESDLRSFIKSLERVKAENRALSYLVSQSSELNITAVEETLTFAPAGTKLLLRERARPSSGSERRQKRRELTAAMEAAADGDMGEELKSFYFSEDEYELAELEAEEFENTSKEVEAVLLDLHGDNPESLIQPLFSAVDADGRLRLFNSSAVTRILYDDDTINVDGPLSSWADASLPPRSTWKTVSVDQYATPLPGQLQDIVPLVQAWRDSRQQPTVDVLSSSEEMTPEVREQHQRVEDAKRLVREQALYGREDLGLILAAKRTIPKVEAILNGTKDPVERKKKRRGRSDGGRYAVLMSGKDGSQSSGDNELTEGTDSTTWGEFMSLVGVLQHYGMLDDEHTVTSLGEMAAKVRSGNELWTTLVLLEPELEGVSPVHLAAILGASQMMDGGAARSDAFVEWELSQEVLAYIERLSSVRTRLLGVQTEFGAQVAVGLDAELMGLVEMWASGISWVELLRRQSLHEGDVCRILRQSLDVLRQVVHLPPTVSDNLKRNARRAITLLDRFPITDDRTYWINEDSDEGGDY